MRYNSVKRHTTTRQSVMQQLGEASHNNSAERHATTRRSVTYNSPERHATTRWSVIQQLGRASCNNSMERRVQQFGSAKVQRQSFENLKRDRDHLKCTSRIVSSAPSSFCFRTFFLRFDSMNLSISLHDIRDIAGQKLRNKKGSEERI